MDKLTILAHRPSCRFDKVDLDVYEAALIVEFSPECSVAVEFPHPAEPGYFDVGFVDTAGPGALKGVGDRITRVYRACMGVAPIAKRHSNAAAENSLPPA